MQRLLEILSRLLFGRGPWLLLALLVVAAGCVEAPVKVDVPIPPGAVVVAPGAVAAGVVAPGAVVVHVDPNAVPVKVAEQLKEIKAVAVATEQTAKTNLREMRAQRDNNQYTINLSGSGWPIVGLAVATGIAGYFWYRASKGKTAVEQSTQKLAATLLETSPAAKVELLKQTAASGVPTNAAIDQVLNDNPVEVPE